MLYRIFLAINIPEEIKRELIGFQKKYFQIPGRWTKPENIHITLNFLGNLDENQLLETINTAKAIISNHSGLELKINKVVYGPKKKIPPRYIWAEIEKNQELSLLHADLEKHFFDMPSFQYKKTENHSYSPHITLARIKMFDFRKMEAEERPEIEEEIYLKFEVDSVEIMESRAKRGGAEYTVLESIPLFQKL